MRLENVGKLVKLVFKNKEINVSESQVTIGDRRRFQSFTFSFPDKGASLSTRIANIHFTALTNMIYSCKRKNKGSYFEVFEVQARRVHEMHSISPTQGKNS